MTMYARIEATSDGIFTASLIGWPDLQAHGANEAEALQRLRQILATQLKQETIVPLDVHESASENPWLALGDAFGDNPLLDEVTREIAAYRTDADTVTEPAA